jgi:NosR/NirI family nitrous oxide reductase transcriptional regulator
MSRPPLALLVLALWGAIAGAWQAAAPVDAPDLARLQRLFPTATTFTPKGGTPPHFTALSNGTPVGFAFWTTELAPLERGYGGPIKILVGLETTGRLAGVVVVDHREPFGSFSVDPPEFAAQFKGKSLQDPFRVGGDVDAVSRASMTIGSATRAIRDSARRAARQLLSPR